MNKFNICLIWPNGYVHAAAFMELAEALVYALTELGHDANISLNQLNASARNILIGAHLLDASHAASVPKGSIILNTEQLSSVYQQWNRNVLALFSAGFEVWDYSDRNIEYLKSFGVADVKKLGLGYQSQLHRLQPAAERDVDVLFYGSMNDRRAKILDALRERGLAVKTLFGVYAEQRDAWISRSRLVLNHHFYDSKIFEVVRVFYLMTNAVPVVGEVGPETQIEKRFEEGLLAVPYEALVDRTVETVRDEQRLKALGERGFEAISRYPQAQLLTELL